MTIDQFHNGLRVLRSIDSWELGDPKLWPEFRDSPYLFFIRSDEERAAKIWGAMVKRGAAQE